jgi:hypothetical protein
MAASISAMRRGVSCAAVVAAAASIAGAVAEARPYVPLVDYYITGEVVGRAAGKNAATVELKWDYKCLGDRLGPATFSWTLKVTRREPGPERAVSVGSGTAKAGSRRVVVPPGRWQPVADPFRCETERGAGSTAPEIGREFEVPDYCGWSVRTVAGRAMLEQRGAVEAVRRGGSVTLGDAISTSRRSLVELRDRTSGSAVRIGANSSVTVDTRYCPRTGAWKLALLRGAVAAEARPSEARAAYELRSANARTTARAGAAWTVTVGRTGRQRWTRVAVRASRVAVANARGRRAVVVRAGFATVVRGAGAPSRPRRG